MKEDRNVMKNPPEQKPLSKSAEKKLLKSQKFVAKKAEKRAKLKEQKKKEGERKRKEWEETLEGKTEAEKKELMDSRKSQKKQRMENKWEERNRKLQRLTASKQNLVIDLDFGNLMAPNQIKSIVQQLTYCYAINGRCTSPCRLWLTGYNAKMESQLQKRGFDKWVIEKEKRPYIDALQDHKENLVYITTDSETVLDELDPNKFYIVGGLGDRNRGKGITMKKAEDQGIQTAKLPIEDYMKMSSSQVLTVRQVVEIVLKFSETRDWKTSFFQVIPQKKRCKSESESKEGKISDKQDKVEPKRKRIKALF